MHYLGVEHRDLEPQNVLRKRGSYIFKIIDFGFSDVDHRCPGWRECVVSWNKVRRQLQLDWVNFWFKKSWCLRGSRSDRPRVLIIFFCPSSCSYSAGSSWSNLGDSCELKNVAANTLIPVIVSPFAQL